MSAMGGKRTLRRNRNYLKGNTVPGCPLTRHSGDLRRLNFDPEPSFRVRHHLLEARVFAQGIEVGVRLGRPYRLRSRSCGQGPCKQLQRTLLVMEIGSENAGKIIAHAEVVG